MAGRVYGNPDIDDAAYEAWLENPRINPLTGGRISSDGYVASLFKKYGKHYYQNGCDEVEVPDKNTNDRKTDYTLFGQKEEKEEEIWYGLPVMGKKCNF